MNGHNLTREQAQERSRLLTVERYEVELDLTGGEHSFLCATRVKFHANSAARTFIDAVAHRLHRVTVNGERLETSTAFDGNRLFFDTQRGANELTIEGEFLYSNSGEGLHRFVDPVDNNVYVYTQFEVPDSRRVFAVFEQPDLKASFHFSVLADAQWKVFSNSPQSSTEPGPTQGSVLTTFAPTPPLSSYITAIVAGPYEGVSSALNTRGGRSIPLGLYCRASLRPFLDVKEIFDVTRAGFAFFEEKFGVDYPFTQYNQIFVPEFNFGAMENAGAVTISDNMIFRSRAPQWQVERRAVTILHELAHMWFGDMVTMRWWNDLWLNESFAEFTSTLAAAEATEYTQVWSSFASVGKDWAYRQDQRPSTHPIVAPIRDLQDVQVNFDGITYAKGASVLKQLVAWVGQEHFFSAINRYFTTHAWGNTELEDFLAALESSSGKDLHQWAQRWLTEAGVNTLRAQFQTDEAGRFTQFAIAQHAPHEHPTLRPHRIAIGLYRREPHDGKLVRAERIECSIEGALTEVTELHGLPQPELILLNDDDLSYTTIRLDERSQESAITQITRIDGSLPRAIVLLSLWDATWHGEFSAHKYLSVALEALSVEKHSTVVSMVLRHIVRATRYYVPPPHTPAVRHRVAARLWELTQQAPAGSDSQLQVLSTFAQLAASEDHLQHLETLLEGGDLLEGLIVDQDLRWKLLVSLSAGGWTDAGRIESERTQDGTHTADLWALTAKAAIPQASVKEHVWEALVEGNLSNAQQRATLSGWALVHDPALLAPFRDRYFANIRDLWERHSHEIAENLVSGLYPAQLIDPETLRATDAFLETLGEAHPAMRRLIIEGADEVHRALAAHTAYVSSHV